ncbi:MAG: QueT transporter family protein [Clostridia bacterium]|nr:QueT transporter family protein [Clostridia bacterium]
MKQLTRLALVAGIYVALTVALAPISYGAVQIRIAEAMMLLCCFDRRYGIALTLGCAIANLFGGFGLADIIIGTLATALAALFMGRTKNLFLSSLWAVGLNSLLVGGMLALMTETPFWMNALSVGVGELLSVSVFGVLLFSLLRKKDWIK